MLLLRQNTRLRQCNPLPVITLGLELRNTVLQLFESLSLSLTRLSSSQGIAGSLHGHCVVGVFNNDGGQGLVSAARVDTGDGRVASAARGRTTRRLLLAAATATA